MAVYCGQMTRTTRTGDRPNFFVDQVDLLSPDIPRTMRQLAEHHDQVKKKERLEKIQKELEKAKKARKDLTNLLASIESRKLQDSAAFEGNKQYLEQLLGTEKGRPQIGEADDDEDRLTKIELEKAKEFSRQIKELVLSIELAQEKKSPEQKVGMDPTAVNGNPAVAGEWSWRVRMEKEKKLMETEKIETQLFVDEQLTKLTMLRVDLERATESILLEEAKKIASKSEQRSLIKREELTINRNKSKQEKMEQQSNNEKKIVPLRLDSEKQPDDDKKIVPKKICHETITPAANKNVPVEEPKIETLIVQNQEAKSVQTAILIREEFPMTNLRQVRRKVMVPAYQNPREKPAMCCRLRFVIIPIIVLFAVYLYFVWR